MKTRHELEHEDGECACNRYAHIKIECGCEKDVFACHEHAHPKPQHTPDLTGTNGKICVACRGTHTNGSKKYCPTCCDTLTLTQKIEADAKWKRDLNPPLENELRQLCNHESTESIMLCIPCYDKAFHAVNCHESLLEALKAVHKLRIVWPAEIEKMVVEAITKAEAHHE